MNVSNKGHAFGLFVSWINFLVNGPDIHSVVNSKKYKQTKERAGQGRQQKVSGYDTGYTFHTHTHTV